jgi:hypothetical protein
MQIPVQAPATPPSPPIGGNTTTTRGRGRKNDPIAPLPPQAQPHFTLCEREGHPTNRCPTLPKLHNLIQLPKETPLLTTPPSTSVATTESSTTHKKGLRTNLDCAICSKYDHYTHHCSALPQFCQTIIIVSTHPYLSPLNLSLLLLTLLTFVIFLHQSLCK